jgi:hypothetical protein
MPVFTSSMCNGSSVCTVLHVVQMSSRPSDGSGGGTQPRATEAQEQQQEEDGEEAEEEEEEGEAVMSGGPEAPQRRFVELCGVELPCQPHTPADGQAGRVPFVRVASATRNLHALAVALCQVTSPSPQHTNQLAASALGCRDAGCTDWNG